MNDSCREKRKRVLALAVGTLFAASLIPARAEAAERPTELVPVGQAVGVKLFADGVLVVDLSEQSAAEKAGIRCGDMLLQFNGTEIVSTEQLKEQIESNGDAAAEITLQRGAKMQTVTLHPQKADDGEYRLGAFIRDSMAGIGTMTFYDPQSGTFGALGHGVTDVDTGKLLPLQSGSTMEASVKAVRRGESGDPGELKGDFDLTHDSGTLYANTACGIFGIAADGGTFAAREPLPLAQREEVQPSKATILSNVSGTEVREYEIEIERIFPDTDDARNLLIRVTDPALLSVTGGIVQGMSGSPILQNGKLVGAVTHVLVNDATRGYGILIENMLDAALWDESAEKSA